MESGEACTSCKQYSFRIALILFPISSVRVVSLSWNATTRFVSHNLRWTNFLYFLSFLSLFRYHFLARSGTDSGLLYTYLIISYIYGMKIGLGNSL
jgi:hypothetical protein